MQQGTRSTTATPCDTKGAAAAPGRIRFEAAGDVRYLHTSAGSNWQGAFLNHVETGAHGSFDGSWSSLGLSRRLTRGDGRTGKDGEGLRLGVPGMGYRGQWTGAHESINLFVSTAQIETILHEPYREALVLEAERRIGHDPVVEPLLEALLADVVSGSRDGPILGETIIAAIVQRLHLCPAERLQPASSRVSPKQLRTLQHYVRENLTRPLHLAELATQLDMSVRHLSRIVQAEFGIAPHQYVVHVRVEHAKHLLMSGQASLDEVAEASGFADRNHMSTVFRRMLRTTPLQVRRSGRESWPGES